MGAKNSALVHAFNVGELSVAGMARIDQERTRLGAEIQENLLPYTIGKAQVRPGTKYVTSTASNAQARLIPFVKSVSDTALIEMTAGKMRVIVDDTLINRVSFDSTVENATFSTASAAVSITVASPAVITWTAHGLSAGDRVSFATTGALPTGLTAGTMYYVISAGLATNSFRVSATAGGSAINTSGTQSGTHTGYKGWSTESAGGGTISMASNLLTLNSFSLGAGLAVAKQAVSTNSANTVHALRIVVTRGPVQFRCGSSDGAEDYVSETTLRTGTHSLAFTPTASTYYLRFTTRKNRDCIISQCDSVTDNNAVLSIDAPWTANDLRTISYDQSGDIIFLACSSWQQRMIERRPNNSWSLVLYESDDGPFQSRSTNGVTMTPGATFGNTTLTASAAVFRSTDVGSIIRLNTRGYDRVTRISGNNSSSESVRVFGVGTDNNFTHSRDGTWATGGATLILQRSYDGEDAGFVDQPVGSGNTQGQFGGASAALTTYAVQSNLDNVEHWYRLGFTTGYVSGYCDARFVYKGGSGHGIFRITGFTSATSVSVETLRAPTSTTATDDWQLAEWSDRHGWPSAVRFFDGRLWWGGEDKFWGSESDNFYAFNLETEGDAGSIQRNVATGGAIAEVEWFLPLSRLVIGTQSAEVSVRASSQDETLTPTNVTLKDASTIGSSGYAPVKIDTRGIYIENSGTRLYELLYLVDNQDYTSKDITRLNEDIGADGFLELAVQRKPEPYVWAIKGDGEAAVLLYNPAEEVAGFSRVIAAASAAGAAEIESVCVVPNTGQDTVYLVVKRTINSSTKRYIERLAKHTEATGSTGNRMLDSYVYNAGPVTTFSGLSHLVGETVMAWGTYGGVTSKIGTTYTVNGSGQITLPGSCTDVTVGLAYSWRYKSAKLAYGMEGVTALLKKKRVSEIGLLLANTHPDAIEFGQDFTTTYSLTRRSPTGAPNASSTFHTTYDEKVFSFGGGWDTDSRVCLKGSAPYPATLLGLVLNVETNE